MTELASLLESVGIHLNTENVGEFTEFFERLTELSESLLQHDAKNSKK
jgi:hypothetical protein